MAEQEKLSEMSNNVVQRLSYFTEADSIIEKLGLPSFSIHSESFSHALDKIDSCIVFLHKKVYIYEIIFTVVECLKMYRFCIPDYNVD